MHHPAAPGPERPETVARDWRMLVIALLGSVSARVAAEASCTVTVVRPSSIGVAEKQPATDERPTKSAA